MRLLAVVTLLICFNVKSEACAIAPLPVAMSNHAIAIISPKSKGCDSSGSILVAGGLVGGNTWKHVSKRVFLFSVKPNFGWQEMPPLPIQERGVLASTAVSIGGDYYIIGGYTVAEDGSEKSTPYVFRFDPDSKRYTRLKDMPTPVDDAVSFVYQNRYIYLVSGWHDHGNVSLVQVYDTQSDTWARATDYPGSPVFGHAGGIVGNKFVIADGVAVVGKTPEGKRKFDTVNEQWQGTIDPKNPLRIEWKRLPQLPGKGNYRMAGAGDASMNAVVFTGGTSNAYNYSGIGYNGVPSQPSSHTWAYSFEQKKFIVLKNWSEATMDHRGMVFYFGKWWTIGGMGKDQTLLKRAYPSHF